jgi:TonB-dependent starch-binding outer membrane protein SusC
MLLRLPVVLSSGMTDSPWQNSGEVRNYGFEITTSYKRNFNDFSFDVGVNFTKIYNNVEKLGQNDEPVWGGYQDMNSEAIKSTYLTYTAVGHPIGQFYGWKIDKSLYANGIWRQEDKNANFAGRALPTSPSNVIAGDYIFKDLNGDGKIDESDKTYLGSPLPNFTYGLNLYFKYKAVDLTMFFQGVYGNKIFNMEKYWLEAFHYSNKNNTSNDLLANSWTPSNQDAKYPMMRASVDNNNNYRVSDFYIEDGSYLRLKNLQLGFTFPQKWVKLIKLSSFRVYVGAYNLLTFTKYSGFDPEIGNQSNTAMGIDLGSFPQARTYTCGILVDF